MIEIGAFPFLYKKDKLHIILITITSGNAWILPKGKPEDDMSKAQVAKLESFEEAGIRGKIIDKKLREEFKRDDGGTLIIYPLHIEKVLDKWQEQSFRKRKLVSIKEALEMVTKTEYLAAIEYFSDADFIKKFKHKS
ncbi:NUDIX hydrolase [sulfur-oxidizing endosymbiont of Gigantopelta aegis]|uniref:NUDIX hydrolase n=1 Tax=sulfur-oxidizing endosymbiont of Gigantopelta aegis TaxID=2794934 RepID=UPI0018DC9CEA|nr:NUDIX hydrolase [sulfur-oxidizing endosymbiont of Gigantopelta aegis]